MTNTYQRCKFQHGSYLYAVLSIDFSHSNYDCQCFYGWFECRYNTCIWSSPPDGIYRFHPIPDIRNILGDTVYRSGTMIITIYLGKSVSVELLHNNCTILSTQIDHEDTLCARDDPAIYIIVITHSWVWSPDQGTAGFEGCVVMIVIQSPIRDNAEVYVAQCPKGLSSSLNGLDFGNTTSFSNLFEFVK